MTDAVGAAGRRARPRGGGDRPGRALVVPRALAFAAAFSLYVVAYARVLTTPRVDDEPG